jgi:hypothetical protein
MQGDSEMAEEYTTGAIYVVETAPGGFDTLPVPKVGARDDMTKPKRLRVGGGVNKGALPDGRGFQKCMLATADDIRAWRDAELAGDVELMDARDLADYRRREWPDVYGDEAATFHCQNER